MISQPCHMCLVLRTFKNDEKACRTLDSDGIAPFNEVAYAARHRIFILEGENFGIDNAVIIERFGRRNVGTIFADLRSISRLSVRLIFC
jgi:hypothetical protein